MIKRVLITGAEGFTGRYLAAEMSAAGYEVIGLVHRAPKMPIAGVSQTYACDLCDASGLAEIVLTLQPDFVAHLGAIAFVAHGDIDAIYKTNLLGSRNLLEALCKLNKPPQAVLLASSANVYGDATGGVLDESVLPAPANDYAVSKLAMEYMASLYKARLRITIVRPFNYSGVGQSESFLLPKIVNHIRRGAAVIELGNLDVARDFSDVRTVVQYYRLLLENNTTHNQVFNVCSGVAYTLQEVLSLVRTISGHHIDVKVSPAFVRDNEVKLLIGSSTKLHGVIDDLQSITLAETLRWMIEAKI